MKKQYLLFILLEGLSLHILAQTEFPFQNPKLEFEERVNDLVSRLTVQEKIDQLLYEAPAISRLGVPAYNWWNECLHGVGRAGYATVFPQSISIAASWDKSLMNDVATAISDEARAKHHEFVRNGQRGIFQGLTFWSPNINIFRDPRWGRGHETYGEDPYLTGQMGKEFVQGLQGNDPKYLKLVATAKHYAVHSGPEPGRHEFDAVVGERDLRETYLPAFRTLIMDANAYSVMEAYNRFRGKSCCASDDLFGILRNEWGFKGYVVSDCGAIRDIWETHKITPDAASAAALAVKSGCDLNCGSVYQALTDAFNKGLVSDADLYVAVKRLFLARFKLGMFDPENLNGYAQIPISVNDNPAHDYLALEAARESIVLLKNDKNILPLSKKIKNVAVIGPNADEVQSLWGNYNGVPSHPVTVVSGLKNKLEPEVNVMYEQGCDLAEGVPLFKPIPSVYFQTEDDRQGVVGEYFANNQFEGEPLFTRVDDQINFKWDNGTPDPRLKDDNFSVRWTGYLIPQKSGKYKISGLGKPAIKLMHNGNKVSNVVNRDNPVMDPYDVQLVAGEKYQLTVEYKNYYGDATAKVVWSTPDEDMQKRAIQLAQKSDVVVLVLGLNERLEGEEMTLEVDGFKGGDRTHLNLPATQVELMKAVAATGKPVVLVLINGSALSINWAAENIPAIITAGYPGQQGGNAVADVLFGDYNPAGRLPVTYYKSVDQLPPFEDYNMEGHTYRYFHGDPLYPFGFGLSYSNFTYSNLHISEKINMNEKLKISVDVTNSGNRDGDEVVQLYLTDEKASTPRPIRQLEAFERISLKKSETKRVVFELEPYQLSMINKSEKRVIEPGWFSISVGGKQPGFSGMADANTTQTIKSRFRIVGKVTEMK